MVVQDSEAVTMLSSKIIKVLEKAMMPSFEDSYYGFSSHPLRGPMELYRNQLINEMVLMPQREFEKMTFTFKHKKQD